MRRRGRQLPASGRLAAVAAVAALAVFAGATSAAPQDDYRLAVWPSAERTPGFQLEDVDGKHRTLSDYRGRLVVVYFGYVHCPDACPAELFKLSLVMKKLAPQHVAAQVLFITLDPERDTPAVLKTYLAAFDPSFVGLTGTIAQIDATASGFFVQYARVAHGTDYSIDHSTGLFVLDARGKLRLLGTLDTSVEDLAHDLAALSSERARAPRG